MLEQMWNVVKGSVIVESVPLTMARKRFDLWPRPYTLDHFRPPLMQLSEDVKRTVVFVGLGSGSLFDPSGTAFFVEYDSARYLVTCRHVASAFGRSPFFIRMNRHDGTAVTVSYDPNEDGAAHPWFHHEDPTIDLSAMPANKDFGADGINVLFLHSDFLTAEEATGIGDICYAVGLFTRFSGRGKNIPIVHTGHLASLGDGERVAVRDRKTNKITEHEVYLAALASLPGLSGAPVFTRSSTTVDFGALLQGSGGKPKFTLVHDEPRLLGVWMGSWEGVDDQDPRQARVVPVGMGLVVPVQRLVELLNSTPVKEERAEFKRQVEAGLIPRTDS